MRLKTSKLFLVAPVAIGLLVFASAIFAQAQDSGMGNEPAQIQGITFPIQELGGCTSRNACKAYCDDASHIDACAAFAQSHGLMTKDESDRAKKFADTLGKDGGPGGCTTPDTCRTFCSEFKNLGTCISFAESHGAKLSDSDPGRKVLKYLTSGGTTPGGCTSREACEAYCKDLAHTDECSTFAKNAGLAAPGGDGAKKITELVKNGETPGRCASKAACEAYCKDETHFEECTTFARKAGIMNDDEEKKLRLTGQKGPGGCDSREACEAYCKDETHRDDCYMFAQEHGLLKSSDVKDAKNGLIRLRAGLEQAPPEVASCITSTLGADAVQKIQSGELTPGKELGDGVRHCFEKFGSQPTTSGIWNDASNEVLLCAKEKLGDDYQKIKSGSIMPTPEMADSFRMCFAQSHFSGEGNDGSPHPGMMPPQEGGTGPASFLRSAPQAVRSCLMEKLGDNFSKLESGDTSLMTPELKERMKGCFESFRPGEPKPGVMMNGRLPDAVLDCVKSVTGSDVSADTQAMHEQTPELNTAVRECAAKFQKEQGGGMGGGQEFKGPPIREGGAQPAPMPRMNIPQAALDCVQQKASADVVKKLLQGGQPPPEVQQIIKDCMTSVMKDQPGQGMTMPPGQPGTTMPNMPVGDQQKMQQCPQIMTPARDPATGVCRQFSTPCAVPANWVKGCDAPLQNSSATPPPSTQPVPGLPPLTPLPAPSGNMTPPPGAYPYQVPPNPDGTYPHSYNYAPEQTANILSSPIEPMLKFLLGL